MRSQVRSNINFPLIRPKLGENKPAVIVMTVIVKGVKSVIYEQLNIKNKIRQVTVICIPR